MQQLGGNVGFLSAAFTLKKPEKLKSKMSMSVTWAYLQPPEHRSGFLIRKNNVLPFAFQFQSNITSVFSINI